MNIKAFLVGAALLAAAIPANAAVTNFDPYSGVAGGGDSGADAQGNPWLWSTTTGGGPSAWGAPGFGLGTNVFNTSTGNTANDFTVSFSYGTDAAILTTPSPSPVGYNEYTRFTSDENGVTSAWTPVYSGAKSVTFDAPAGVVLSNGDEYFVNVVFTNGSISGSNAGFDASFSTTGAIPEASTWLMMLAGFGALGFVGYRRRALAA
jgi:hypothetical protein